MTAESNKTNCQGTKSADLPLPRPTDALPMKLAEGGRGRVGAARPPAASSSALGGVFVTPPHTNTSSRSEALRCT